MKRGMSAQKQCVAVPSLPSRASKLQAFCMLKKAIVSKVNPEAHMMWGVGGIPHASISMK